jgi:lipopolysaccharide assembly outer membrane protein LptD (OstA)
MRAGGAKRDAGARARGQRLIILLLAVVASVAHGAEVRVLSGPGAASTITVGTAPDARVVDRTPGAEPAAAEQGPASKGQTFTGEITLWLSGFSVPRAAAVDVNDPVVSAVRLFPEETGTLITIFVRQPVTYSVSRPSAAGDIRVEVHGRTRGLVATPGKPGGPTRFVRPQSTGAPEVSVDAESLSYDQQGDVLTARGGVTLTRGDTTLTADEVVYDRMRGTVEAEGHVVMSDPDATVEGERGHLDLNEETGWVESATGSLPRNRFILEAGRMEKQGGAQYSFLDGVFTTCECGGLERPSWSIAGEKTDVSVGGAGVVKGLKLRVKDVPVLWVPYFAFPANTDRASGFLLPRVGFSNRRGFVYEQPFYWAINKSSDATVAVDVETEARIGVLGEYRYALSRRARGQFAGAYFNEQIRGRTRGTTEANGGEADIPQDRFAFAGRHTSPFYGKSRFFLDLFTVSDDFFLREINNFAFDAGKDLALRSTRLTASRTGIMKHWNRGLGIAEADYYQDLIDPQSVAVQRLPNLQAEHGVPLLGDRLVGRVGAEAVNFYREEGAQGLRGDLAPELFLPLPLGRFVHGSVLGRVRETAYHLTDTRQVAFVAPTGAVDDEFERFRVAPELPRLDRDRTRELAEVHARVGTEVARVFSFPYFGLARLKHSVEPEVQYLYVPQTEKPLVNNFTLPACAALPPGVTPHPGSNCDAELFSEGYLFDERDAINHRNFVSYGITTRLLARGPEAPAAAAAPTPEPQQPEKPPDDEDDDTVDDDDLADSEAPETVLPAGLSRDTVPQFVGPPAPRVAAGGGVTPPPRELVRATVLHGYDISRRLVSDSHFSDIDLGIRLTPMDWLGLSYNATASIESSEVRGQAAGIVVREPWFTPSPLARYQTASTLAVSYRFIENDVNRLQPGDPATSLLSTPGVNEIDAAVYLRLGNYFGFTFLSRYDLNETNTIDENGQSSNIGPHFLERNYLVRLISRCNCWILDAGMADKFNPDERVFRVQLTLVGLGSFGKANTQDYMRFAPLADVGGPRRGSSYGGYQ